ncbi:hypothetical protein PC121_g2549 [Phytophthora cactorum]|nr:hypothetical protein PC120_g5072 [Phytophthora cactorum]KAG3096332.1 hypothetical protein PC121_g2549 [Phytophthora cactorum]KAG4059905.1 hypothetical protein PC123_g5199 [Phytophthora cactorum]
MVGFVKKDIATLWNVDYVQDGAQIDEQLCKDALEEVENLDFKPIFRKVYSKTLDTCRQQALAPVSGDALAKIHEIVPSAISGAHRHWEINEHSWNALKSLPGCRDQGVHRDLPTFETARALLKHRVVQGSVIVALMDNTRLHVYPGCFGEQADREKRKTPVLQRVTVLVFRGDLAHARPKYDELNVRLHCYVQVSGVRQKLNSTEAVMFQTFRCDKCLRTSFTRRKLAEHRRTCSERGRIKCPYPSCNAAYSKCNSLTQHIKRSHTKKGETRAIEEVRMNEGDDEQSSESGEESGETEENEEESEEESEESSEYSGNDSSADEE